MDEQIAQLHFETSKLMGVDFLPIGESPLEIDSTTNLQPLEEIQQDHKNNCPHCTTATAHTKIVFGAGNPNASLMFIGEAPGEEEDKTGVPFVGPAGEKLNQIIEAMGFSRSEVYIANVLKSRPKNNRTPLPSEANLCGVYLQKQIECISPRVIVALGSPATKFLLQTTVGITKLRGHLMEYNGIPVMPTYHPAYLLRNYTKEIRQQIWSDMQQVLGILAQ
jgi:DNA polymerase